MIRRRCSMLGAAARITALLVRLGGASPYTPSLLTPEEIDEFSRPTTDTSCSCKDPLKDDDSCYEPVCPAGYYRCCYNCGQSSCFDSDTMYLSWRGIPECIKCKPGDFCDGCDTFKECPPNDRPGREGPRVSRPKSKRFADCESCPAGKEASFDRSACMPTYKGVCNEAIVRRCMNNCEADDPSMGKNMTPCEQMKCMMYCAKSWSSSCAAAVGLFCKDKVAGPTFVGGFGPDPDEVFLVGCDVDCSGAPRHSGALLARLAALVTLATGVGRLR